MVGTLRFAHPTHRARRYISGLLRFARNDVECRSPRKRSDMRGPVPDVAALIRATGTVQAETFPRHENARVMHRRLPSESQRARGTPDAGRTRGPCVQKSVHFAHASNTGSAGTTGIPRAMGYGLYVISSVRRAVWPPSPRVRHARLDPSVGGSGPHDFAVRFSAFVSCAAASIASRRASGDDWP
jgi:hypothetical protein